MMMMAMKFISTTSIWRFCYNQMHHKTQRPRKRKKERKRDAQEAKVDKVSFPVNHTQQLKRYHDVALIQCEQK